MPSLRGRLFSALLGIFIGAWVAAGVYLYLQFAQASSGTMDRGLEELANTALLSMPSDISEVSSRSTLSLRSGAPGRLEKTERWIQVWSKERRALVLWRRGAPTTPLKPDFIDGFATLQMAGEQWRVYAVSDASNQVQVQAGQPMSALTEELRTGLYYALGISSLALLAVGLAVKLVVRWSFQPVMTVQSAMTSREALDLTPLPAAGLPSEVRPLVDSFNRLLARLEEAVHVERRFIVDAAHELRTPLAVLLGQAQVARRARTLEDARPVLDQLMRGAERSARLSQQLLHSARIERPADPQTPIELADIITMLIQDFEMTATQKEQSISVHVEPGLVRGNLDEIGILVSNVLDNALRYAGRGGHVAVRCVREGNTLRLEVLDDGPGVPEADRGRIFDRFYRVAGSAESGSGIGLSLVARIARSHAADISTGPGLEGRGFGIVVRFPMIEERPAPP
ncbi:ATP-binding protein [Peristeroidobacter soli]|uniref:ATP-binding protein n=1 Tax=Peristeroidobacter soli TaxID=2497877 RepID=UPI00158A9F43|nr:ATP-binding protein [Peristeroidobacter soli]